MGGSIPTGPRPRVTFASGDDLARQQLRACLLQHISVTAALLALNRLREADRARYHACLTATAATLRMFPVSELDYLASVVRQRVVDGTWSLSLPVSELPARNHADPVGAATIELAAEALARRLTAIRTGSSELTDLDLADERYLTSDAVRKAISRLARGMEVPKLPPASARSRRRLAARQREIAATERERLDLEVGKGRMLRVFEHVYAGRSCCEPMLGRAPQREDTG